MRLPVTPSQTVGPFLAIALRWDDGPYVVAPGTEGAFWLRGRVVDGSGEAVPDALVETWQADPDGRFAGLDAAATCRGFGRSETVDGAFAILTVKPGQVPGADGRLQAPHVAVSVFARGLLHRVVTRLYFGDDEEVHASDPVLASLDAAARATLVAQPSSDGYSVDIVLQGSDETVFFAV